MRDHLGRVQGPLHYLQGTKYNLGKLSDEKNRLLVADGTQHFFSILHLNISAEAVRTLYRPGNNC